MGQPAWVPTAEKVVCGLIEAKVGIAHRCYPITIKNNAERPETRFQLDEKQQINAMATILPGFGQLFFKFLNAAFIRI